MIEALLVLNSLIGLSLENRARLTLDRLPLKQQFTILKDGALEAKALNFHVSSNQSSVE
jgi:hypothetical protein